jgi:hypothetical protein
MPWLRWPSGSPLRTMLIHVSGWAAGRSCPSRAWIALSHAGGSSPMGARVAHVHAPALLRVGGATT